MNDISDLMNNASIIMTFMQRGWTDTEAMQEWLTQNALDLSFDEILNSIPSINGKDTTTNYGAPNRHVQIIQVPTPVVLSQPVVKQRRPILFLIYLVSWLAQVVIDLKFQNLQAISWILALVGVVCGLTILVTKAPGYKFILFLLIIRIVAFLLAVGVLIGLGTAST